MQRWKCQPANKSQYLLGFIQFFSVRAFQSMNADDVRFGCIVFFLLFPIFMLFVLFHLHDITSVFRTNMHYILHMINERQPTIFRYYRKCLSRTKADARVKWDGRQANEWTIAYRSERKHFLHTVRFRFRESTLCKNAGVCKSRFNVCEVVG